MLARRVVPLHDTTLEATERAPATVPVQDLARLAEKLFSEWSF